MQLSGRMVVQSDSGWQEVTLDEPASYPGLPGVRKLELHSAPAPASRFNTVRFEPGSEVAPHVSPTVNYWFVLEGEIESIVPGQPDQLLRQGDCCVQLGVEHGWRATGLGAVLLAVVIDLP